MKPIDSVQQMQQPQETVEEPIQPEKEKKPRGRPRKIALESPKVPEISGTLGSKSYNCEACGKHYDNSHIWHYHNHMAIKHGIPNPMAKQTSWRQKAKRARQAREDNQAAGVSHSEPVDDNPSAAYPRPAGPNRDAVQKSHQVEGMPGNPDQDHEPLHPLKLARTGRDVPVDAQVRNEFVDILGTPNGDSEASNASTSNVGGTLSEQQQPEPPRQSGSNGLPRATRNQERQQQNAAPEIRNNGASADQESDDGMVDRPLLRSVDGVLVFRGYKPGMTLVQTTDGKHIVYPSSAPCDPDAASTMPISPNTLVTPVRTSDVAGSSSTPLGEEIGNFIASRSAQNRNSVTNNGPDDSDPDDPSWVAPRNTSRHGK